MAAICHGQFFTSISEPFVPSPQSLLILTEKLFILSSKVLDPIGANKRCLPVGTFPRRPHAEWRHQRAVAVSCLLPRREVPPIADEAEATARIDPTTVKRVGATILTSVVAAYSLIEVHLL